MTTASRLDPARPAARPAARRLRRAPAGDVLAFRTPVRGHVFAGRPPGGVAPRPGQPVRLVREPENPRDPLAVAVWSEAATPWRLGYLDRAVAARLAPRLDDGQRFSVELDGWVDAPGSTWRRPLLRVASSHLDAATATDVGPVGRPPGVSRRVIDPGERARR